MSRKILFVCLGNICRSPLAEGIFQHICEKRGLKSQYSVDSAGTGDWHIGQPPDKRAIAAAKRQGIILTSRCRQFQSADYQAFDYILAMDRNNYSDLMAHCPPQYQSKIKLMRDYDFADAKNSDVPDPYHGGPEDFDAVFTILDRTCNRLLDDLESTP
jgi:protein-tyrosine phosphatase